VSTTAPVVLITGGYGCIGAETAKWLLRSTDAKVIACGRTADPDRMNRAFNDTPRNRLHVCETDVTQQDQIEQVLDLHRVTHVIHLAALQTPDCNRYRDLGLQINLAGTQNVLEAVKNSGQRIERLVFASSVAVYGPRADYPAGRVPMLAPCNPVNVYGVWKLAGEHLARIFHSETSIPTVCLRPGVLFGPGRDAGLTSTPTAAMKHLVSGRDYQIPFFNAQDYLYAPDVGAAFGIAAVSSIEGYHLYTLPSQTMTTSQIVGMMYQAAAEQGISTAAQITIGTTEVPFICDLDYQPFLNRFPETPQTPPQQAIAESLRVFEEQRKRGWLWGDE
jgi:nucleoside-diphosphate-sugar epimerase